MRNRPAEGSQPEVNRDTKDFEEGAFPMNFRFGFLCVGFAQDVSCNHDSEESYMIHGSPETSLELGEHS